MKKVKLPPHHNSLDAPVFVWNKVHETADLSWLLIKKRKISKAINEALSLVWENIYNEYIREFGVSESYSAILEKMGELILLREEYASTNDRSNLTLIQLGEQELKEMRKNTVKSNFLQLKMSIEKHQGHYLPLKEISIREFYSYLTSPK